MQCALAVVTTLPHPWGLLKTVGVAVGVDCDYGSCEGPRVQSCCISAAAGCNVCSTLEVSYLKLFAVKCCKHKHCIAHRAASQLI